MVRQRARLVAPADTGERTVFQPGRSPRRKSARPESAAQPAPPDRRILLQTRRTVAIAERRLGSVILTAVYNAQLGQVARLLPSFDDRSGPHFAGGAMLSCLALVSSLE